MAAITKALEAVLSVRALSGEFKGMGHVRCGSKPTFSQDNVGYLQRDNHAGGKLTQKGQKQEYGYCGRGPGRIGHDPEKGSNGGFGQAGDGADLRDTCGEGAAIGSSACSCGGGAGRYVERHVEEGVEDKGSN